MDEKLKSILVKLARGRATANLSEADFAYVASVVGQPEREAKEGPAPLWKFIRRKTLLFKGLFDYHLDAEIDPILVDAGAAQEDLKGYTAEVRRMAIVSGKDALKRAVRRHLTNEQTSVRVHASRLVGLLELEDTVGTLVDSLESGREERADWGAPVIAASLESLAMLGHPQTRPLAMKYVSHDDWSLRRAAHAAALVAEGTPTNEELRRILDTQFESQLFSSLPEVFLASAKNGGFTDADLERLIEQLPLYVKACEAIAHVVVGAEWKGLFKKLFGGSDPDLRAALAARVAWSDATWAVSLLRENLDEEAVPDVCMCAVAALGTVGEGDDAFVRARLASDIPADKVGATWATVGTGKYVEELKTLLRDPDAGVRRAALAALAINGEGPYDAEHLEMKLTELLNKEDTWWPWSLPLRCLTVKRIPFPVSTTAFRYVSNDVARLTSHALDEVLALFREHPLHLLRWLRADVPASQRVRALAFAGLVPDVFDAAIEDTLLSADRLEVAAAAALEVLAGRGPTSRASELKIQLALVDKPKAPEGAILPAVAFSFLGDSELRKRASSCLKSAGVDAEPYVSMLLASGDAEVARVAADVVAQLAHPSDPLLADVARLLTGEARKLGDLPNLERLVVSLSPRVRTAIAELGALPDASRADVLRFFPFLVADRDENVAASALGALAAQAGDVMWVKELVLAQTWSPNWITREKAVSALAQIADVMYLPRLLELAESDDGTSKDNAVRGLERIAELRPELGLVVFDVRDPYRIVTRFGLGERINYEADKHTEALRVLLLGLDKRKDDKEVKKHIGRKVMITSVVDDAAFDASEASWTSGQFEALAMHLKVVYTDDESGAIVAEVVEEATGEVLSALLQSASIAVRRVAWS
ncbi:MAG: hypothetical protein KF819_02015 [Labilithrix sp.]|nr:hypothetical protein [Labilithrix sp.]